MKNITHTRDENNNALNIYTNDSEIDDKIEALAYIS